MILARRSSPAPSARHICRTKTKKTKSLTCLRHPLPSDSPRCRAVAAGGRGTKPRRGGIFRSLRTATMPLLTELDSFTPPFLQICQSYGLRRLRVLRATKIQTPNAPNVHPKMNMEKSVQERNAPVFAPVFTALRRGELLRRGKECGFGVRGHVRALVRRDMSRRGKAMSCHRTPRQLPPSSIPK
jgi:hypothetical protein